MRILVVEDDTTLGRALQEFLTSQGFAVDWLTLGAEARPGLVAASLRLADSGL